MSKNPPREETTSDEVLAMLQRHRGYRGWRIRPYPYNPNAWLAETYTYIGRGNRKGWRALWDEKRDNYRTFANPRLAHAALIALQEELNQLENLLS